MRKWLLVLPVTMVALAPDTVSMAASPCVGDDCGPTFMPAPEADAPSAVPPINAPQAPMPSTIAPPALPIGTPPAHSIGNSCAFAFNDVCDEPSPCMPGTDSHDCAMGGGE